MSHKELNPTTGRRFMVSDRYPDKYVKPNPPDADERVDPLVANDACDVVSAVVSDLRGTRDPVTELIEAESHDGRRLYF